MNINKMKFKWLILSFFYCLLFLAQENDTNYNEALAKSLGADDYGMKSYFLVILKSGDNGHLTKDEISQKFNSHMANIKKYVAEKKLIVAGPISKNDHEIRGIFIFDVKTEEELKTILQEDGAIATGILLPEIYSWYGSAALPFYIETHEKIQKIKF